MKRNNDYFRSLYNVKKFNARFARKKPVVFYSRYIVHNSFIAPILSELTKRGEVVVFCGDKHDPQLQKKQRNLHTFYLDFRYESLFRLLKTPVLATAATSFAAKNKPKDSKLVHIFHSLVSINYVYTESAYDGYDVFFATGEHHYNELKSYAKQKNWKNKAFFKIGYPKIIDVTANKQLPKPKTATVLLAPSWGKYNLLREHGLEIVRQLLDAGYTVTVRPHTHSYQNDKDILDEIRAIARTDHRCIVEEKESISTASLAKADLMISDWSGAAYEFAFGFLKPVLFIDVPKKINNQNQKLLTLFTPMEVYLRDIVGKVSSIEHMREDVESMLANEKIYRKKIVQARKSHLYNLSNAHEKAALCLENML